MLSTFIQLLIAHHSLHNMLDFKGLKVSLRENRGFGMYDINSDFVFVAKSLPPQ